MNWSNRGILVVWIFVALVAVAETSTPSVTADCNKGQSLNSTLFKLSKQAPTTLSVNRTCTEYGRRNRI